MLLVVEIVSPRSGSEQHDRVDKVIEYARAGIPQYWLVDLEPEPRVVVRRLTEDGRYHVTTSIRAGSESKVSQPLPFTFGPGLLREFLVTR